MASRYRQSGVVGSHRKGERIRLTGQTGDYGGTMATLLDHENEAEAAACRRIRQIAKQYECDESESRAAKALRDQMEAREPAPVADPLIWICAAVLALVVVLAAGMIARL